MTLTGEGDLVLHEGSLHIQPPPFIYPGPGAGEESTRPLPTNTLWRNAHPPKKALTVSGGSLDVRGEGAAIRSTRTNSPALSVSVGLMDDAFEGNGDNGLFGRNDTDGQGEKEAGGTFSYSGVALAVNVRETGREGERVGGDYGDGHAAAASDHAHLFNQSHHSDLRLRNLVTSQRKTFVFCLFVSRIVGIAATYLIHT